MSYQRDHLSKAQQDTDIESYSSGTYQMQDQIEDFLSYCSGIDFGKVELSDRESAFYRELNDEVLFLCNSLPESTQTDALLFFMQYSRTSFGDELDFFWNYFAPTWSIIYWLIQSCPVDKELTQEDSKNARTGHAMAMTLHSLDNHLADTEIPVTHLNLLLRSQAWMIMNNAFQALASGVDGGGEMVRGLIDEYYSGIYGSDNVGSLDSYCELFRKQMATGLIAPVLLTKKIGTHEKFAIDVQFAYISFGIAWRLLDDIKDIEIDMIECKHSSIYVCLPENIKQFWDKHPREQSKKENSYAKIILDYMLQHGVIERIKKRIHSELELAASIADRHRMAGLANEFRCLLAPLKNNR